MKTLQQYIRFVPAFMVSVLMFTVSCSDDEAIPGQGNYFPLTMGSRWMYEQKFTCNWPDETETCFETAEARILDETLEWNAAYQGIQHPAGAFQFVKVNDSEYFGMGFYLPEYKFLDDELPVGGKWGDEDEFTYQHFEILEVNGIKKIKGRTYYNVIVVKQETSYGGDPRIVNVYQYARNIGLIYRKQVVTSKDQKPDVREFSLINYFISPK